MLRYVLLLTLIFAGFAAADAPRAGWAVHQSDKSFKVMTKSVRAAVKAAPIAVVTHASASDGARNQGHDILGNRVFGLFRNDYARRMLAASVDAGIEAPIRLYLTENTDGGTTLSYKTPSAVFAPYFDQGGAELQELAAELDRIFADIAAKALAD